MAVRDARLGVIHQEMADGRVVVPGAAPHVGDITIEASGELTVYLGYHTHSHFAPSAMDGSTAEQRESEALEQLIRHLRAILTDKVVIWSLVSDGQAVSGGSFARGALPSLMPKGADAWLWSGRRYTDDQ